MGDMQESSFVRGPTSRPNSLMYKKKELRENGDIIEMSPDKVVVVFPQPTLTVERLDPSLPMPKYAKDGDSGLDLQSTEDILIAPHQCEKIGTGIRCEIPSGYEIQIRPRSSMSILGLPAQFGTVDEGYRGEIKVVIANLTSGSKRIRKGDRIAQAVLAPATRANIVEGVVSTDTERGADAFGSTGR